MKGSCSGDHHGGKGMLRECLATMNIKKVALLNRRPGESNDRVRDGDRIKPS